MSAARGIGTLSIIRIEPSTVNQELIASCGEEKGGRASSAQVGRAVADGRTQAGR